MMTTREKLLEACKYYKGETTLPEFDDQNKKMLWGYERTWVDDTLETIKKGEASDYQCEMLFDYINAGLSDFMKNDDRPVSYKALLFNRYCKTAYSMSLAAEPFKEFYKKYYE